MVLQDIKINIYAVDTNKFIAQFNAPTTSMDLGYLQYPVFCMFMLDYRNHVEEYLDGDNLIVRYQLTKEQLEQIPTFGETVLIVYGFIKNERNTEYILLRSSQWSNSQNLQSLL